MPEGGGQGGECQGKSGKHKKVRPGAMYCIYQHLLGFTKKLQDLTTNNIDSMIQGSEKGEIILISSVLEAPIFQIIV